MKSSGKRYKVTLFIANMTLVLFSAFIASIIFDRLLIFAGLPSKEPKIYSHPPNLTQERSSIDFRYTFKTNSQGLRYKEIPLAKPNNTVRVLVVGDSFTEGYGVELKDTFSWLLEEEFTSETRRVNFINGGLGGAGPLDYARLFVHVGLSYEPDALLICIYANDVSNTKENASPEQIYESRRRHRRLKHLLWPRIYTRLSLAKKQRYADFFEAVSAKARSRGISEEEIQRWKGRIPPELVDAVKKGQLLGAMLSYGLLKPKYWVESIDIEGTRAERKWSAMVTILEKMLSTAQERGIWIGIVYIPARFQYDPAKENPEIWRLAGTEIRNEWLSGESEIQRRLESWTTTADIPFLDLTPALKEAIKADDKLNFRIDDHWSPRGHQVAALSIAEWLSKTYDLLPPRRHRLESTVARSVMPVGYSAPPTNR